MIIVLADIEVASGQRDAFLTEFHKIVADVRAEDGCIEYGPAIDVQTAIDAQADLRPDVVTVVEKWRDEAALAAHLVAPHMNTYRERVAEMVRGVTLRVLSPADAS